MFEKARNLYNLKKQADSMKKQMEQITTEVEEKGIKIIIRGDQQIEQIFVDGEEKPRLKKAINKAIREVQKKVAKKMRGQLGELGLKF